MPTIYLKTIANQLTPGAAFVFHPEQKSINTVLKSEPNSIAYVNSDEEEVQTLSGVNSHICIYLVKDQHLEKKWRSFLSTIGGDDARAFRLLMEVTGDSIWTIGIHNFMARPCLHQLRHLLRQLSSQAKDNPEGMTSVVGAEMTKLLLGYLEPVTEVY